LLDIKCMSTVQAHKHTSHVSHQLQALHKVGEGICWIFLPSFNGNCTPLNNFIQWVVSA
jgi:hypothetical protein